MKLFILACLLAVSVASASPEEAEDSQQQEKRELSSLSRSVDQDEILGDSQSGESTSPHWDGGFVDKVATDAENGDIKSIIITKEIGVPVPQPVPVPVVRNVGVTVPNPVPYPVEKRYPVLEGKSYPVAVDKPVPYPVEKKAPYPVHVPVKVAVPHPVPVHIPKPVAVPVSVPVKVPIPQPYQVYKPVPVIIKSHGYEGAGFGSGLGGFFGYNGQGISGVSMNMIIPRTYLVYRPVPVVINSLGHGYAGFGGYIGGYGINRGYSAGYGYIGDNSIKAGHVISYNNLISGDERTGGNPVLCGDHGVYEGYKNSESHELTGVPISGGGWQGVSEDHVASEDSKGFTGFSSGRGLTMGHGISGGAIMIHGGRSGKFGGHVIGGNQRRPILRCIVGRGFAPFRRENQDAVFG